MSNTVIKIKRSGTSSNAPSSLEFGELALNYADGKLFYKAANNAIIQFESGGGGGGGDSFGTVNANGTLVVADTPGDILTLESSGGISIVGDAINDKITISGETIFDRANSAQTIAIAAFDTANAGSGVVRVFSVTTISDIEPNSANTDQYVVTALDQSSNILTPTGSATNGQKLVIRLKDDGTPRTLSWNVSAGGYRVVGTTLPTTTTANKVTYVGCIYNSDETYWDVVAVATEA
jgi:hypothetical protein